MSPLRCSHQWSCRMLNLRNVLCRVTILSGHGDKPYAGVDPGGGGSWGSGTPPPPPLQKEGKTSCWCTRMRHVLVYLTVSPLSEILYPPLLCCMSILRNRRVAVSNLGVKGHSPAPTSLSAPQPSLTLFPSSPTASYWGDEPSRRTAIMDSPAFLSHFPAKLAGH